MSILYCLEGVISAESGMCWMITNRQFYFTSFRGVMSRKRGLMWWHLHCYYTTTTAVINVLVLAACIIFGQTTTVVAVLARFR